MEWNEKLQIIIDYVENHLQVTEEPIQPNEIAKIAECSFDFFQKVFSYMNKLSFAEYVRGRKLTLAGYDLKSTNMKIVDISYKYGYNSPTSFTKAFIQFHGISPSAARKHDVHLSVLPKMQLTGRDQLSWQIVEKPTFRLIGKCIKVSMLDNNHYQQIPEFWHQCQKDGTYSTLVSLDTANTKGLFGMFASYDEKTQEIDYALMVISHKELPQGYIEVNIPETMWAIFDCIGAVPQSIHKGWKYLNEEWLAEYPFQHAPCPELEWYSDKNVYSDDYLSQIWIPILKEEK